MSFLKIACSKLESVSQGGTANDNTDLESAIIPISEGLNLWLDATDGSTLITSGADINEWQDKSGLDNHAIASYGSPQFETNAVVLNGDEFTLNYPRVNGSNPFSLFLYLQCSDNSRKNYVINFGINETNHRLNLIVDNNENRIGVESFGPINSFYGSLNSFNLYDTWVLIGVIYSGTVLNIYINNSLYYSKNHTLEANEEAGATIGNVPEFRSEGIEFIGKIRQIIMYDRELSEAEKTEIYDFVIDAPRP